jgi:hypothetical protein
MDETLCGTFPYRECQASCPSLFHKRTDEIQSMVKMTDAAAVLRKEKAGPCLRVSGCGSGLWACLGMYGLDRR